MEEQEDLLVSVLERGNNYRLGIWSDNTVDKRGRQNLAGSPRHHEQKTRGLLPSHIYNDLLHSTATTV